MNISAFGPDQNRDDIATEIYPMVDDTECLLSKVEIFQMTSCSINNMWSHGGLLNSSILFWELKI